MFCIPLIPSCFYTPDEILEFSLFIVSHFWYKDIKVTVISQMTVTLSKRGDDEHKFRFGAFEEGIYKFQAVEYL